MAVAAMASGRATIPAIRFPRPLVMGVVLLGIRISGSEEFRISGRGSFLERINR